MAYLFLASLAGLPRSAAAQADTLAELSSEAQLTRSRLADALEHVCLPTLTDSAALAQELNAQVTEIEAPAACGRSFYATRRM